jgi:hypothetical protein
MSRKGKLNKYYVRIYPEKPEEDGKTCYTWLITSTTKSSAIKRAGNLAFKLGIEVRQVTVFGMIIPKSEKRRQKMIDDYIKKRQEMIRLKKLKPREQIKITIPTF